jgi:hypothetical protein
MLVLILRSAHAEDVRQTSNARARVSKDEDERVHAPSCFETHRSATMLGRRHARFRCDAPQHDGRGRTVHSGETKPMESMPACSMRNRPAVAENDRRLRSIVFGLLFTMNAATRTCDTEIWRSIEGNARRASSPTTYIAASRCRRRLWNARRIRRRTSRAMQRRWRGEARRRRR